MSDLLALLKRLSNRCDDDTLRAELQTFSCPECCMQQPGHEPFCELKAQIDRLEAEEKVQTMWTTLSDNFNDQMRALEDKRKAFEIFMDRSQWTPEEIERMKARYVELISFEPPASERNEGHA